MSLYKLVISTFLIRTISIITKSTVIREPITISVISFSSFTSEDIFHIFSLAILVLIELEYRFSQSWSELRAKLVYELSSHLFSFRIKNTIHLKLYKTLA